MCGARRTVPTRMNSGTIVTSEKIGSRADAACGARAGAISGGMSIARNCAASETMSPASISPFRLPSRSCAIQPVKAARACSISWCSAAPAGHFFCIQRFITCSTSHATSPRSISPTMRPLPFSVWKPRRMVVRISRSCGCAWLFASSASMVASTSPASSRNTPSNSASTSGRAAAALAGAAICCVLSAAAAFLIAACDSTTVESAARSSIGVCALS